MQSPASQPALPLSGKAAARGPQGLGSRSVYWRWVLLLAAPLVAALALALYAQRNTEAAQDLAQEAAQLQARTRLLIQNAALNASQSAGAQGTPEGFKSEFPAYELRLERLQDFLARLAQLGRGPTNTAPTSTTPTNTAPPTSYRQTALGDSGLLAHSVSLSTTTSYSAWRDLVDDVLWADPALALTSLSLNRSDASASQVRVQAVFTFYMQAPEAGGPNTSAAPNVFKVPKVTNVPEAPNAQQGRAP